jgi:hypothetical protein
MHLLATICAHGFGHLGQSAPVLNALRRPLPALRLTVASTLPEARLRRDMFASWCLAGHALNGRLYGFESVATCGRFGSSLDSHSTELAARNLSSGLMLPVCCSLATDPASS